MKTPLATALIAVALATPALAQPANPVDDRLKQLSELQRHSVLRRAILDSAQPCKRVEQAAAQGRYKNLMMWTARCVPGGDYALFIGPDASVQVRSCPTLRQLGLPACALPPKG